MKNLNLMLLMSFVFLTVSCGSKNKSEENFQPQQTQKFISMNSRSLPIHRNTILPSHLKAIHNELARNSRVGQGKVLQALVREESRLYEARTGQNLNEQGVYGNLIKVASLIPNRISFDKFKNAYLNVFQGLNRKEIEVHPNNHTLVDPLLEGRLNSLSGSKIFDFLLRVKGLNIGRNMVMVMQNGHITPGFLIPARREQRGPNTINFYQPKWNLIGIETTSKGLGFLQFGDPDSFNGQLQIIDADEFLMIELFKSYLSNPVRAVKGALNRTCRKYDLNCQRFPSFGTNPFFVHTWGNNSFYSGFNFSFSWSTSVHSVFAFGTRSTSRTSTTMRSFSHEVVTGARYINNRYMMRAVIP